ncbi:MAG: N-acetylmuramoyl-L-alanine amidase [Solirubrobacteraceae bacterium]
MAVPAFRGMDEWPTSNRRRRRSALALVAAAYAVALAAAIASTAGGEPRWSGSEEDPGPRSAIPAHAPPAAIEPLAELPAESERRSRRPARPLPRARPSADRPAPPGPVPAPPALAFQASLGDCCSEPRGGLPVDAIVLHATELPNEPGIRDLRRLARFFAKSSLATQAANDAAGNSSRMVADDRLAYHATYWNTTTVGIEQMGYSSFTSLQWTARRAQLESTARWVAYWARSYRIPIRRCQVAGIRYNTRKRVVAGEIVKRGVCSHAQLDPRNRDDPGPGYPWRFVLARARAVAGAANG